MAIKPKSTGAVGSRRNGNNLYDRLEEARNRRAEVLAHKEPANDVARRPVGLLREEPEAQPQMSRFPKIVMPPPEAPVAEDVPPKKASKWPFAVAATLLAGFVAAVIAATPREGAPNPTAFIDAPPIPSTAEIAGLTAARDAKPDHIAPTPFLPTTREGALPKPAVVTRPTVAEVDPFNVFEIDASPAASIANETTVQSAASVEPLAAPDIDAAFASGLPANLRVSLNIPVQARATDTNTVLRGLEQSGFDISAPRSVNFTVRDTQVRFFHASDAAAAKDLAVSIGGIARDFTGYTPSPPKGFVEVYVAGRSAPAAPPPTTRGLARDVRQLTENIGNALRSLGQ